MAAPEVELLVVSVPDSKQLSAPAGPHILEFQRALELMQSDDRPELNYRDEPLAHHALAWKQAPYEMIEQLADEAVSAAESNWDGLSAAEVVEQDLLEE
jgi:hypothetical protein